MPITNWEISREDFNLAVEIAKRAKHELVGYPDSQRTILMDLNAAHANGCPLDFAGLLAAPLQDFSHDIYGIRKAINRNTGKLDEDPGFMPRYALANSNYPEEPRNGFGTRDDAVCKHCHKVIRTVPKHYCPKSPNQMHEPVSTTPETTLPGGITIAGGTEEDHAFLRKRGEFVAQYCQQKRWLSGVRLHAPPPRIGLHCGYALRNHCRSPLRGVHLSAQPVPGTA
jgi:hypothetical protein